MQTKKITLSLITICLLIICLALFGCASQLDKSFSNLQKSSKTTVKLASELTQLEAPKYPNNLQGNTENSNDEFILTISNSSAELIVKQAELEDSVSILSTTNTTLKNRINAINEGKKKVDSEDIKTLKTTKNNIDTINNNISEKAIDVKQAIATINAEIKKVSTTTSASISESQTNVSECYSKALNALNYVNTQVSEVNTLLNSFLEVLNKYSVKE